MSALQQAWAALAPRLVMLEPIPFTPDEWAVIDRLHARFNDREAHTHLPLPIARFRDEARQEIFDLAKRFDDVRTDQAQEGRVGAEAANSPAGAMAIYAQLYNADVDAMMAALVPQARYRKGHYAYGRFTVPAPHGLHTDHSAEDPTARGEPICIARIETLSTHYVAGDYSTHDAGTQSMLKALRYWIAVPEGQPEDILERLLERGTLRSIPVNQVMLMVAGNSSENAQATQHIAANPPAGGQHSAFFQRQYKLTVGAGL